MGTPRLSKSVDQMRNVQRTASCGDAIAREGATDTNRRSSERQAPATVLIVALQVAFNSDEAFFANNCEASPVRLVEVAQHALFAQQPGLQISCAGESETMQVLAEA